MKDPTVTPSLMFAMPCREEVRAAVVGDLFLCMLQGTLDFQRRHPGGSVTYHFQRRMHVVEARTMAVRDALERSMDWILWLDDDMAPPRDLLDRLLATGKDFVSAVAYQREPPFRPCVQRMVDDRGEPFDPEPGSGPVRADLAGFACMLTGRRVLEDVWKKTDGRPFASRMGLGEDLYFCLQARACGHELWVVPELVVGHVTDVVIGREQREAWLAQERGAGSMDGAGGRGA